MSLAEQLKAEGLAEGLQRGREDGHKSKLEIAKRLLSKGSKPTFVADITGLPIESVNNLRQLLPPKGGIL